VFQYFLLEAFTFYLFYNVQSRLHLTIRMKIYVVLHKNMEKLIEKNSGKEIKNIQYNVQQYYVMLRFILLIN